MEYFILSVSLAGIVFGADFLVSGAVAIARRFKVSDFVIGAAIVGVGTKGKITRTFGIFLFSAFVGQTILLPALTFLLTILLNDWISPMIALGMILVAACIITTPLNFSFWGKMYLNFAEKRMILPELILAYLWRARGRV